MKKTNSILSVIIISSLFLHCATPSGKTDSGETAVTNKEVTLTEDTSLNTYIEGIDISHYNGRINWTEVQNRKIAFVFCKATEGIVGTDPLFSDNWASLQKAGILRGAYHFYTPADDPLVQAQHFLHTVQLQQGDLVPVLDIEENCKEPDSLLVNNIRRWLLTVESATGKKPLIYTNKFFWDKNFDTSFRQYPLWIADWDAHSPSLPNGWTSWTFWQYTSTGTELGISSDKVDQSRYNKHSGTIEQITIPPQTVK